MLSLPTTPTWYKAAQRSGSAALLSAAGRDRLHPRVGWCHNAIVFHSGSLFSHTGGTGVQANLARRLFAGRRPETKRRRPAPRQNLLGAAIAFGDHAGVSLAAVRRRWSAAHLVSNPLGDSKPETRYLTVPHYSTTEARVQPLSTWQAAQGRQVAALNGWVHPPMLTVSRAPVSTLRGIGPPPRCDQEPRVHARPGCSTQQRLSEVGQAGANRAPGSRRPAT